MSDLDTQQGDDRRFLRIVERLIDVVDEKVRELWVVRVDNWFDHKWLRFSGKGRVPFEDPSLSHPGVALDEFSQDKLTFPPFSPKRILAQDCWTFSDFTGVRRRIHSRVRQHSATNLHRRVADFSDSMVVVWFSSRTEDNRQGSIMQYSYQSGKLDAWYMSFRLDGSTWQLVRAKGIERERANAFVATDDPLSSVASQKP